MSISNRTEFNSTNNKISNSTIQLNEISSSDSNNNSEGKHIFGHF